jgi:hypothetical protein
MSCHDQQDKEASNQSAFRVRRRPRTVTKRRSGCLGKHPPLEMATAGREQCLQRVVDSGLELSSVGEMPSEEPESFDTFLPMATECAVSHSSQLPRSELEAKGRTLLA